MYSKQKFSILDMQNMALFARPGIQSRGAEVVGAKQSSMMKMYSDLSSLLMRDCIFFLIPNSFFFKNNLAHII